MVKSMIDMDPEWADLEDDDDVFYQLGANRINRPINAVIENYNPKKPDEIFTLEKLHQVMDSIDSDARMIVVWYSLSEQQFYFPDESIHKLRIEKYSYQHDKRTELQHPQMKLICAYYDEIQPSKFENLSVNLRTDINGNICIPVIEEGRKTGKFLTGESPIILDTKCFGRRTVNDIIEFTYNDTKFLGFISYT